MASIYPHYDKTQRKGGNFKQLPKGAYVVLIKKAEDFKWLSGDHAIKFYFDIAEGEYRDFYKQIYEASTNEDKKWPMDGTYLLNVPDDSSAQYVWDKWNTFWADLEDSNDGYVFAGDLNGLRGRLIGGCFRIEQSESKATGNIYDHTRFMWSKPVDDIRSGHYGRLPNDKLIGSGSSGSKPSTSTSSGTSWMDVAEASDDEVPFL